MADLQELFSRLKSSSTSQNGQGSPQPPQPFVPFSTTYQQPSISSPLFSPPIGTPNATGSGIISPKAQTPAQDAKAANLLNLLRFNGSSGQPSPLTDLQNVANTSKSLETGRTSAVPTQGPPGAGPAGGNPQDFLLQLLNKPKAAEVASSLPLHAPQPQPAGGRPASAATPTLPPNPSSPSKDQVQASRETTPMKVFGSTSRETTPFEAPQGSKGNGMFTYVNPFEHLSASTPKKATPAPQGPETDPATVVRQSAPSATVSASSGSAQNVGSSSAAAPPPVAEVKKEPVDDVLDTWQNDTSLDVVQVYNFPMRPFVSIRIRPSPSLSTFRDDSIMDIVRLKKDFDQTDRTLATASPSHIAYAMAKPGGFRIIRQDSGRDKQVFKSSQERIFHVQIKPSSQGTPSDVVLAAGVQGAVFWTKVALTEEDKFSDDNLESRGFILPAINTQSEENTSGSPVKTRSKVSSRHADIFAISRGKSIHIIAPERAGSSKYIDSKSRVVDTSKYFQDYDLKITTGKACKDFAWSEDDRVIASLDKAGRIRFWDVQEISEAARSDRKSKLDVKTPLLTYTASMASEKVSPTSVMFVDKERPCVKGVALRYLLVGFKQNHLLQLWDLGLRKPVQEIHFPHDSDSDAICSISYHPKTGIIAVAHPTRNSIYFVHLSAPRYHIPAMDQAKYISLLASEDATLPKPESTAIMSGIRELSFGSKGQLRSVEMLTTPAATNEDGKSEEILFELYAMHSTGLTCLSIKKADLGWNKDDIVINPVDAEKSELVTITPITSTAEVESSGAPPPKARSNVKDEPAKRTDSPKPKVKTAAGPAPKEVVKSVERPTPTSASKVNPPIITAASYAMAAARPASMSLPEVASPQHAKASETVQARLSSNRTEQQMTNGDGPGQGDGDVPQNIASLIATQFDNLYGRIEEHRRLQDVNANSRQGAVLELVSSTLTGNVEKTLAKIVSNSIQQEVLPTLSDVFAALAERQLAENMHESVRRVLPQQVQASLPDALSAALRDEETLRLMAGPISADLSAKVLATMEGVVRKTIAPTISQTISTSVQKTMTEMEARLESQRSANDAKFDRLANLIFGLSETLQRVTTSQSALQEQVTNMQRQLEHSRQASRQATAAPELAASPVVDPELAEITDMMQQGRYEEATIRWLQSPNQSSLFDELFVRINTQYLQQLSPLIKLSVSAAVSISFERNVDARLDWLNTILSTTDQQDPEIAGVAPKIMNVLLSRIQGAYMQFAESDPQNPVLRKLSGLSRSIAEVGSGGGGGAGGRRVSGME